MRELRFAITCGEKTCASEPGKFCEFVSTRNFGTEWWCYIFARRLYEEDGWLQRCTECLEKAEEK